MRAQVAAQPIQDGTETPPVCLRNVGVETPCKMKNERYGDLDRNQNNNY